MTQMQEQLVRFSKFLSLVLRHEPQKYGLTLDEQGWAKIDQLLDASKRADVPLTREAIQEIVAQNDKQRFALSEDGYSIRARQGHSIEVDLQIVPLEPPAQLYHGTADRFISSIREQGLLRRSRQHVHLSADASTALKVGQRHGKPVILTVQSGAMHRDGHHFYQSENGVWLVDAVPVSYLVFPE